LAQELDQIAINKQHNKTLHLNASVPFVPHSTPAAGEIGCCAAARDFVAHRAPPKVLYLFHCMKKYALKSLLVLVLSGAHGVLAISLAFGGIGIFLWPVLPSVNCLIVTKLWPFPENGLPLMRVLLTLNGLVWVLMICAIILVLHRARYSFARSSLRFRAPARSSVRLLARHFGCGKFKEP
jgi:hypothetical protein